MIAVEDLNLYKVKNILYILELTKIFIRINQELLNGMKKIMISFMRTNIENYQLPKIQTMVHRIFGKRIKVKINEYT
jgi:hypothetical protein